MLKNYLKTALRNLYHNKVFSLINIFGLAIGIASFILIALYVLHELSYDRYHEKAGRIYRITENLRTENELLFNATSAPPMGPAFASEFPEVIAFARFAKWQPLVQYGDKAFFEKDCYLADSSVLDIFSFRMLQGDPHTALVPPHSAVLTETTARKYFGGEPALGKGLEMDGTHYTVTGVIADVPETSHFKFDMLLSYTSFSPKQQKKQVGAWYWNSFHTYLLLAEGEDRAASVKAKIPAFIEKYMHSESFEMHYEDLPLQPLTSIYLDEPRISEIGEKGSKSNLYILSSIALFILLIACFNYVNLATARASRRLKEVGLRKVLGAGRKMLVGQFLGESLAVTFIATILGLVLAMALLVPFNDLLDTTLPFSMLLNSYLWIALPGLSVALGVLAGGYPAFLVSGYHPLLLFRGSPRSLYSHHWVRKLLVASQFIISITFLAGTLLVFEQLGLLRNLNLGFDKEQTLVADFHYNREVIAHIQTIKNEMENIPGVTAVTTSAVVPGQPTSNLYASFETNEGEMSGTNLNIYFVDHDFVSDYGIKVLAGRTFSRDFPADDSTAFMVNEAAVRAMGWESPERAIGRRVEHLGKSGTIIGVVQDFHYRSLHNTIDPLLIHISSVWFKMLSLKIRSGDIPAVVAQAGKKWRSLTGMPFDYTFLDQDYDRLYKAEAQLSKVVTVFSSLAVFIACLGLIGLTSFSIERRFREIGIRKTLGASVRSIVMLISGEFVWLVVVAFVISVPITYYMIDSWLENFAERIRINPVLLAAAGLLVFAVSWLVSGALSVKAAMVNPTESLRSE